MGRLNKIASFIIQNVQRPLSLDGENGYLTIFHDYEGSYANKDKKEASYHGVNRMLVIEKRHNVRTTYNIVGKLAEDFPEIINRIIESGHEVASHTYKHDFMTYLNKKEIDKDIKATIKVFSNFGVNIKGLRSPQNRWSFSQLSAMYENGMLWSAENDPADFPYYILPGKLLRFPVTTADFRLYAQGLTPGEVNLHFMEEVKRIVKNKCYGSIGFHPWVQGEDEKRLNAYDEFLSKVAVMPNLKIKTFSQAVEIVSSG